MKNVKAVSVMATVVLLGSLAILAASPAYAAPTAVSVTVDPPTGSPGQKYTIYATVGIDADCPSGETWDLTSLTVTKPLLSSQSASGLPATANCGDTISKVYPDDFPGGATDEEGDYLVDAEGITKTTSKTGQKKFVIQADFVIPEFALPAVVAPAVAFGYLALRKRLRRK